MSNTQQIVLSVVVAILNFQVLAVLLWCERLRHRLDEIERRQRVDPRWVLNGPLPTWENVS